MFFRAFNNTFHPTPIKNRKTTPKIEKRVLSVLSTRECLAKRSGGSLQGAQDFFLLGPADLCNSRPIGGEASPTQESPPGLAERFGL